MVIPADIEVCAGGAVFLGNRLFVLLRKNGAWLMPKGHRENGETLEEAACREVQEESGLDPELGPYLGKTEYSFVDHRGLRHDKEVWWYAMAARNGTAPKLEEELFLDYRLLDETEIDVLTYADDREIARRAFAWRRRSI